MATGSKIRTFFEGNWHSEDKYVMRAADHGSWLGSSVFDGARYVDGVAPDLKAHCDRVNHSAEAMMITPTVSPDEMVEIVMDGIKKFKSSRWWFLCISISIQYWKFFGKIWNS